MRQKHIGLAIGLITAFTLPAQHNSLVVFSASGEPFFMKVDQEAVNQSPQSNVKAFDLSTGRHVIEIALANGSRRMKDSLRITQSEKYDHKEFTYVLVSSGQNLSLQFKGVSEPSGPVLPPVPEAPKETAPVVDNSIYGHLYQAKQNRPVFFRNYDVQKGSCEQSLTDKDISYGVKLLAAANDEERQMGYMQQIISNNCYSTAQLQQLLLTFASEMDRLELTKAAYPHLTDRRNAAQLLPVFKYQSLKDNYTAFLNDQDILNKQRGLNCSQALDDARFQALYAKLKNGGYENEKLALAKKSLTTVCLSAAQAGQVAQLFLHDREKLECLKFMYPILVDKEQAAPLAELFQFSETKNDFLKFIAR